MTNLLWPDLFNVGKSLIYFLQLAFFQTNLKGMDPFLWDHWYPCFRFLVTSALGFKVRDFLPARYSSDRPLVQHLLTSWRCRHGSRPPFFSCFRGTWIFSCCIKVKLSHVSRKVHKMKFYFILTILLSAMFLSVTDVFEEVEKQIPSLIYTLVITPGNNRFKDESEILTHNLLLIWLKRVFKRVIVEEDSQSCPTWKQIVVGISFWNF